MADSILKIAFLCYAAAAVALVMPKQRLFAAEKTASILFGLGFALQSVMVALRWQAAGRPPFANMYEALVLFAWSIALVGMVFSRLYRTQALMRPAVLLIVVIMSSLFSQDSAIKPLMPALKSRWMAFHVVTYFIGYAALALSFVLSAVFLLGVRQNRASASERGLLDSLSYQLIIFGFPFLTLGMISGSVWANVAWGTYWNWDPKETCSLITWLVYIVYLHLRALRGWKEVKAAWVSILGFLATLFTFIGVNYVLRGLHSYAS